MSSPQGFLIPEPHFSSSWSSDGRAHIHISNKKCFKIKVKKVQVLRGHERIFGWNLPFASFLQKKFIKIYIFEQFTENLRTKNSAMASKKYIKIQKNDVFGVIVGDMCKRSRRAKKAAFSSIVGVSSFFCLCLYQLVASANLLCETTIPQGETLCWSLHQILKTRCQTKGSQKKIEREGKLSSTANYLTPEKWEREDVSLTGFQNEVFFRGPLLEVEGIRKKLLWGPKLHLLWCNSLSY